MYAATLRFLALIRPCRALIEVRLHVSNLPHPCWNSVESHESIDKSEKRGCSTRLRSNFFFLAEFNTKIKALRVGNGVRSTGGISGITDQGCSESKSIGALESERLSSWKSYEPAHALTWKQGMNSSFDLPCDWPSQLLLYLTSLLDISCLAPLQTTCFTYSY